MPDKFSKTVGSITLTVEGVESPLNMQCVKLSRNDFSGQSMPLRMTFDELRDLQYIVNRALGT